MIYQLSRQANAINVRLAGMLSFHQHEAGNQLMDQISGMLGTATPAPLVVFDLGDVTALDSHWLGVVLRVLRRCKEQNSNLVLERANADIRRMLEIVQLDKVMEVR